MTVQGSNNPIKGGAIIPTHLDHRIGMAAIVLGLSSKSGVTIDDISPISTSFPGFVELMQKLGADIYSAQE